MKFKLVFIIIFALLFNAVIVPFAGANMDDCISAGSAVSSRSDIFFTGYTTLMMKLAIDLVSDGKTLPQPVRKEKREKEKSASGTVFLSPQSLSGENLSVVKNFAGSFAVITANIEITSNAVDRNILLMLHIFILFYIMLIFSLPRGSLDNILNIGAVARTRC